MGYYKKFDILTTAYSDEGVYKELNEYKSLILSNHKTLIKRTGRPGKYDRPINKEALKITLTELVKHFDIIEKEFLKRNTPIAQLYEIFKDYAFIEIKNKYKKS